MDEIYGAVMTILTYIEESGVDGIEVPFGGNRLFVAYVDDDEEEVLQ